MTLIDQTDGRVLDWAMGVFERSEYPTFPVVALTPPIASPTGSGVSLYLLDLTRAQPTGHSRRLAHHLSLRYLVSTWSDNLEEAHRLLSELVFAALENSEFDVESDAVPLATWAAFGVIPRPSFIMRVPLRRELPEPATSVVRMPLVVRGTLVSSLNGIVLTPNDVPLVGARVEITSLGLSAHSDRAGRFHFATVPVELRTCRLDVLAKGRQQDFTIEMPASSRDEVVIHFDLNPNP